MKTPTRWKPAFLTALLTLFTAGASLAQSQMNYQGRLTDSAGNAVPDAQYSIIFDIFDSATGGTKKWGPQVITADVVQGRFNVILGPTDTASRNIVSAFDGGTRYLQITYQGNPILPRQQILSSPTAFFAQNAGQLANVYVNNGNVGIGTTTPGFPLTFANTLGDKISLFGQGPGNSWGFGIQATSLQIHSDTSGGDIVFGYGSSAALTETMRIKGNGNVGIGTPTPDGKLTVVADGGAFPEQIYVRGKTNPNRVLTLGYNTTDNYGYIQATEQTVDYTPLILNRNGGKVGIGTATPNGKLDIGGNTNLRIQAVLTRGFNPNFQLVAQNRSDSDNPGSEVSRFGVQYDGVGWDTGLIFRRGPAAIDGRLEIMTGGIERVTIREGGNVGIGTINPTQAKLVVSGSAIYNLGGYGFLNSSNPTGFASSTNATVSIWAESRVAAAEFNAFSDARIKNIQARSDGAADLATLTRIEITDYTHKDVIAKDSRPHKKVIAQQVEKVYPQAVNKSTDVVPDIYQKATVQDGWVALATDLKVGERVRLIGEKEEAIHEVLEVRDGAFRTAFQPATDAVFVYGREVKDFRTVDYEAIAMLNVSATQELARKLAAQSAESTQLRAALTKLRAEKHALAQEVAALTARDQAREARLTRLETALGARAVNASLK